MKNGKKKSVVATMRFARKEMAELEAYLRHNPFFDSLSSLGRVATMEFIRTRKGVALHPSLGQEGLRRPWFLWDYDMSEAQVHEILTHAPFEQRKWLLGRMLDRLGPAEIVRYVSLETLREALPHLRLDPKITRHWEEALTLWISPSRRS